MMKVTLIRPDDVLQKRQEIEKSSFWCLSRTYLVEDQGGTFSVELNIFQRIAKFFVELFGKNYFNRFFDGKGIAVVTSDTKSETKESFSLTPDQMDQKDVSGIPSAEFSDEEIVQIVFHGIRQPSRKDFKLSDQELVKELAKAAHEFLQYKGFEDISTNRFKKEFGSNKGTMKSKFRAELQGVSNPLLGRGLGRDILYKYLLIANLIGYYYIPRGSSGMIVETNPEATSPAMSIKLLGKEVPQDPAQVFEMHKLYWNSGEGSPSSYINKEIVLKKAGYAKA